MGGWTVKYNNFGAIARRMPRELADGVDEVAESMVRELKTILWKDTGMIRRVTTERGLSRMHAEVDVGWYLGQGFYSGFQEFGVPAYGRPPRPIVAPLAHQYERQYRLEMAEKVRKACDAR